MRKIQLFILCYLLILNPMKAIFASTQFDATVQCSPDGPVYQAKMDFIPNLQNWEISKTCSKDGSKHIIWLKVPKIIISFNNMTYETPENQTHSFEFGRGSCDWQKADRLDVYMELVEQNTGYLIKLRGYTQEHNSQIENDFDLTARGDHFHCQLRIK